jgi:acetyl-CoA acetyltransferase
MRSIELGALAIRAGESDIVVAGEWNHLQMFPT